MKIFEVLDHRNAKRVWCSSITKAKQAGGHIARQYYADDISRWHGLGSIPQNKPFVRDYVDGSIHFPTIEVREIKLPKRDFLALLNEVATELPDLDALIEQTKREATA